MRAIDTNVVARYLLQDDPAQAAIAIEVIRAGVIVSSTVMMETGWLLSSRYRQSRDVVAAALLDFIDLPVVHIDNASGIRWALDRYRDGADLADMLHLVEASVADLFATFDAGIAKSAGAGTNHGYEQCIRIWWTRCHCNFP